MHTYFKLRKAGSIDEIIQALNEIVTVADGEIGTPFKAVSYHGEITNSTNTQYKSKLRTLKARTSVEKYDPTLQLLDEKRIGKAVS